MTAMFGAVQQWSPVEVNSGEYISEKFPSGLLDWVLDDPAKFVEGFPESTTQEPEKFVEQCPELNFQAVNSTGDNVSFKSNSSLEAASAAPNALPDTKACRSSWSVSSIAQDDAATPRKDAPVDQNEESKISCKMDSSPKAESPSARKPWTPVHSWLMETVEIAVPHEITKATTSVDCLAIDPETLTFIPKIEHPECKLNHDFDLRSEPAWRRSNMTSGMQINRELRARARLGQRLKEMQPAPAVLEEAESSFPRAHCTIRPATDGDIDGILDIVKAEQGNGGPAERSGKQYISIGSEDIAKHLQQCRYEQRPFVVATSEDELLDRSKWPAGSDAAYKAYIAYRGSIEPKTSIVGFAFAMRRISSGLDIYQDRVDRSCCITLFVHPDHRGKKYGSALLDRILMCVSPIHRSLVDFDWKCDDAKEVYESLASKNARQYARAFVEYEARGEDKVSPVNKLLEKFGFLQVGHMKCVRNQGAFWWDRFIWEFEAQCVENVRG